METMTMRIKLLAMILFAAFFYGCEPAYPAVIQTASWFYPFGTILKVTSLNNGRSINVTVNDRGPAKRLVKKGRVIDLSKKAFESISPLSAGVIPVRIERLS